MPRGCCLGTVKRRSRKLFVTTKTELAAIVRPASIGFSKPAAASGIAATLYANAQNRLPLITARVRRDSRMASAAASQVAADQGQVARLDGHVGAGAHGQAQVGLCERGRVVDAVADHGHHSARRTAAV